MRRRPDIRVKRVHEPPAADDGTRFLVDRLWPRGLRKDAAKLDRWLRDVAPGTALRRWFRHDPKRWDEFRRHYFAALDANPGAWQALAQATRKGRVTLLYAARDPVHNNAVALQQYLLARIGRRGGSGARAVITES